MSAGVRPGAARNGWLELCSALRRARGHLSPRLAPAAARAPRKALRLERDATLALRPGARGLALRGLAGTLLVTQEGDPQDHVLGPGDGRRFAGRGRVVVWALEAGAVELGPVHVSPSVNGGRAHKGEEVPAQRPAEQDEREVAPRVEAWLGAPGAGEVEGSLRRGDDVVPARRDEQLAGGDRA